MLPTSSSARDPAPPPSSSSAREPLPRVPPPGIPREKRRARRRLPGDLRPGSHAAPLIPSLAVATAAVGCILRLHHLDPVLFPCAPSCSSCSYNPSPPLAARRRRSFPGHRCPRRVVNSFSTNRIFHRGRRLWGVGAASALLLPPLSARNPHLAIRACAAVLLHSWGICP